MRLPDYEFSKPATLAECLAELRDARGEVRLLGGGTDVIFNMRGRLFQPDLLLSVKDLPELQQVRRQADGSLAVGAGCRLTDLERHPDLEPWPGLVKAIRSVASRHVRNMATLGGNLNLDTRCWYTNQTAEWRDAKGPCIKTGVPVCHAIRSSEICVALNASDIAPALVALDARVQLRSADTERDVALADYYTEDAFRHTVRRPDELMTAVIVPPFTGRMSYFKETARKGNDFAYATVAAVADGQADACRHARIVLGSLTTRPVVLTDAAQVILRGGLSDAAIAAAVDTVREQLGVLTNLYTPAAYKGRIARSLVRQALEALREPG